MRNEQRVLVDGELFWRINSLDYDNLINQQQQHPIPADDVMEEESDEAPFAQNKRACSGGI